MCAAIVFLLIIAIPAWGAVEAPSDSDEHTVLLLHMDEGEGETLGDSSDSELSVTMMGPPRTPKWEAEGMFGGCLRFDGVNADEDGDERGDADGLILRDQGELGGSDGLTVEAWIYPERVNLTQALLSRSGGARWAFFIQGATLFFSLQVEGENTWERARSQDVIRPDVWQHVAAVYDTEAISLYVDGNEVAHVPTTGTPLTGPSLTVIGCDTDSRPIDSAIRGFKGLMDEVRVSKIARDEFNVSNERRTAAAAAAPPPPVAPPTDRPKYPDPPVPDLNARGITVVGRVHDEDGAPIAGVQISDGERMTRTDEQGRYTLAFDLGGQRFVTVTRPRGYAPVGEWYLPIPIDGEQTQYSQDFAFATDPLADRDEFNFLACSDTQFNDVATFRHLRDEYDQLTRMSGDPGFFTIAGDLTLFGSQWEMDLYREIVERSHLPVYNCFGGHDGNYARETIGRGSIYNYQRNLGPAWYSWDYGPAHFVTYVSETSFLTEDEARLQNAWLQADFAAQPEGTPIVIVTHQPPTNEQLERWLEGSNIVAVVYGHWHLVGVCGHAGVPFIDTAPMRGRDWGAFTRNFRVVSYTDGGIRTQVRICGQAQRLDIVAPQNTVSRGVVPVQVKAYDTTRRIAGVTCEIEAGGQTSVVALARAGYHTWAGEWDARKAPAGELIVRTEATDEDGRKWREIATAQLADATPAIAVARDWPGFFRAGHSRAGEQPLGDEPQLVWSVNTGGRLQKAVSPILYRGRLYVGVDVKEVGHPGAGVSCYEPTDGSLIWRTVTDSSVCFAPAAADGVIYAVSSLGACYALDAETGAELWRAQPFGPPNGHRLLECCPVIEGDELIIVGNHGRYKVLDRADGQTRREIGFGGGLAYFSFPSIEAGRIYGGIRKFAVAHDLATGEQLWRTAISTGKIAATPVSHQGRLYVNAARLSCLDPTSGELLWEQAVSTNGNGISVAAPAGDVVLAHGVALHAFDAETGAPRWVHQFPYDVETAERDQRQTWAGQSSPAIAGGVAYVGHDDGWLYAFALEDGELLWRYRLGVPIKGSPVVSGNALFVCDWDGNLYAFAGQGE